MMDTDKVIESIETLKSFLSTTIINKTGLCYHELEFVAYLLNKVESTIEKEGEKG